MNARRDDAAIGAAITRSLASTDVDLAEAIEVRDWSAEVDRIRLDVVPGRGMTYNGFQSLEACLRSIVPDLRGCPASVLASTTHFVKSQFGFG